METIEFEIEDVNHREIAKNNANAVSEALQALRAELRDIFPDLSAVEIGQKMGALGMGKPESKVFVSPETGVSLTIVLWGAEIDKTLEHIRFLRQAGRAHEI